ncbi:substrate-binding domain-containing protein [soil metagenome]
MNLAPNSLMQRVIVASLAFAALPAVAGDLRVLTAGAFKPVLLEQVAAFEQASGVHLLIQTDTAGALNRRVAAGERFDVLFITQGAIAGLAAQGRVDVATTAPLAKVGIGVGVRQGAPLPDITSVESFRSTLLAARAIATVDPAAGGSSGIYLWDLFDRWGIGATLRSHAVLVPGGLAADRITSGEADLALQQTSEILAAPGITLVGPIPAEIQNFTIYSGVVASAADDRAQAIALLSFLQRPAVRARLADKGMQPP